MLSIVTPTLNSVQYIETNINSVLNLKIPFQHIIVDGGSTDGTLTLIEKFPHLIIIHQKEKLGMYQAIDMGFKIAKGNIITWVNSDDFIIPTAFQNMYQKLNLENSDLCYSNGELYFSNDNLKIGVTGKKYPKFLLKNKIMPFIQPCSIYTKRIYHLVGGLHYNKYKISGDLDLFMKFAAIEKVKFSYLPEVSVVFLKHGNSLGDKNSSLSKSEVLSMKTSSNFIYNILAKLIFKLS